MAGRIPDDIIEKIRDEVAIEDVIGHFVPLKPKGASFWGCCPFHDEKTPSFHVHPARQIYYCFGCQRGGSVYRFLMEREGMSFPEAVQWCASRIGLDLTRFLEQDDGAESVRSRVLEANRRAAEWFAGCLKGTQGKAAREYLRGRGIQPEMIESFQLGFAPADGSQLMRFAQEAGLDQEALLAAQLLRRKEGQAPFSYFRSRLIFPIQGVAQKIHGFGGRILGPGEPKYLNSPETSVFHKRSTLYALPTARKEVIKQQSAILVEGYLDAIALHQVGWTQSVATCGTAFTPEQAAALGRHAERVILLFDGDRAGLRAAFKAADVALAAGLDVRIAQLPEGQDPADMVRAGEESRLQELIGGALGFVDALAFQVERHGDSRSSKERAIGRLREIRDKIPDRVRADLLLQEASQRFKIPLGLLRDDFPESTTPARGSGPTPNPSRRTNVDEAERMLLRTALANAMARRELLKATDAEDFSDPEHQRLFELLAQFDPEAKAPHANELDRGSGDLESLLAGLLAELSDVKSDYDFVEDLRTAANKLHSLKERKSAEDERNRIASDYLAGGDAWREELTRKVQAARERRERS